MPQITCPNCGLTINLENRKEIDVDMIKDATGREPKTFTELMHITKLSRKTLSLRLKELCETGALIKEEGMYQLNGASEPRKSFYMNFKGGFTRKLDKKMKVGLMLVSLALCFSASGYVLAMLLQPSPQIVLPAEKPIIIGSFAMDLNVSKAQDLYAWQAVITFNASELKVIQVTHGNFLDVGYPFFFNATDMADDVLLVGGSAFSDMPGANGNGRLATIVFGYFVSNYAQPVLAPNGYGEETFMLDSNLLPIPIGEHGRLSLMPAG